MVGYDELKGKKVVQMAAGGGFNLVLTESGDVWSFGRSYSGQLGHGDQTKQLLQFFQ